MANISTPDYMKKAAAQTAANTAAQTASNGGAAQTAASALRANNTAAAQDILNKAVGNTTQAADGTGTATGSQKSVMTQNTSPAVPTTQTVPTSDGLLGIRSSLNNYGINDVGWNDATKSVTVNGKDYYTPSTVIDGTAYGSDKDILNIINSVYNDKGKTIASAKNYVADSGISNAVQWQGGQLTVGGQIVPVAYVSSDGTAYADKDLLDNAIAAYKQRAGITGNQEVYDNYKSEYGDRIEEALDTILNRDEWSYDPEDDPAYQSYRDAYTREGNRAYQNAYAQAAANTGGYGSSAGMTAAGQQLNYYMQQLGDRIPELEENSYNRYLSEQELNQAALKNLLNVADEDYNKAYTANRDSINDSNTANYYSYLRDNDARDYNRQVETEDRLWDVDKELYAQAVAQGKIDTDRYAENADLDLEAKKTANETAAYQANLYQLQAIQAKAEQRGSYTDEEAATLGLTKDENGNYPSPYSAEAQKALYYWENYARQETQDTWNINNGLYGG